MALAFVWYNYYMVYFTVYKQNENEKYLKMKNEKAIKQIGIWMDHENALIIEPSSGQIRKINSPYKGRTRIPGETADGTRLGNYRSTNNESHKHYRQENDLHSYYKQLADEVHPYDEIFIFGPSTAHSEFQNYLLKEKNFHGKKIAVEKADYITENQMREMVRNFFTRNVEIH